MNKKQITYLLITVAIVVVLMYLYGVFRVREYYANKKLPVKKPVKKPVVGGKPGTKPGKQPFTTLTETFNTLVHKIKHRN